MCVSVTHPMKRNPVKKQKENSLESDGEGKQRKGRLIPLNLSFVMKSRQEGMRGREKGCV